MKSILFLISLLVAAAATATATDGDSRRELIDGGWQPIKNLNDSIVGEIVKFALDEYNNKTHLNLNLVNVTRGETQIVAGINYRLVFFATFGSDSYRLGKYEATVWVNEEGQKKLTSFRRRFIA
ncbi:cysteine proteinase inhibitor 1-like [Phalaenopsis equestris]|uniref:cysteine proteinase inhibitor 1-like n=1 Tax=Phalaenopsis equestris TaxID=78828 RepID=UPI0009E3C616|nr:cysteine proteinase inhibitor 1-like [Phalaenopsis equestris]